MIFRLFRRSPHASIIARLYGMIVAQARAPAFYQSYGVPDTVNGRFEMLVLHLVLVLRRLEQDPALRPLGQRLFDQFCGDMDDSLREMGVGDLAVPKTMRKFGDAFYGRQAAYRAALEETDDAPLTAALARNILGRTGAAPLTAYVRSAAGTLSAEQADRLLAGEVAFPDPAIPSTIGAQ